MPSKDDKSSKKTTTTNPAGNGDDGGNGEPTPEGLAVPIHDTIHHGVQASDPRRVDADVQLQRSATGQTGDQALWMAVRRATDAIAFERYRRFIDHVFCLPQQGTGDPSEEVVGPLRDRANRLQQPFHGVDAYLLLKAATEAFLLLHCCIDLEDLSPRRIEEDVRRLGNWSSANVQKDAQDRLNDYLKEVLSVQALPYLKRIVDAVFNDEDPADSPLCNGLLTSRIDCPCFLELIWSYWHEEGMLSQGTNAISLRFQNKRANGRDPLAELEIDPLRPLNNLFWGYIQDEPHRLTVSRRAYEYSHHYGLTLLGRAVPRLRPADTRSKFLEAFHGLLHRTWIFYQEDADTTVIADGFPLLNGLKEVHMLLAEGAHNQYGDLPWTARVEMLVQEWLLARPEIRAFLRGRAMVPYPEAWMSQVDTLKRLEGWSDTPVSHFRDLGVYGEQILLSIRFGDWIGVNDQDQAKNWARYWKPEVQSYLHAYRATTGVDLTNPDRVDATLPAVHLQKRLRQQTGMRTR